LKSPACLPHLGRWLAATIVLLLPLLAHAAQEYYFKGTIDDLRPPVVPSHASADTAKDGRSFRFRWFYKNREKIDREVRLHYYVIDDAAVRSACGSFTRVPSNCNYWTILSLINYKTCPESASSRYTVRSSNIDAKLFRICRGNLTVDSSIKKPTGPLTAYAHLYKDLAHVRATDEYVYGHYGNVWFEVDAPYNDGTVDVAAIGQSVLARFSGKPLTEAPAEVADKPEAAPPEAGDSGLEASALPTAQAGPASRHAYLPASKQLPAKVSAKARAGTAVTFAIVSGRDAILQAGGSKGQALTLKAGREGVAEVLFYYTGENVASQLEYEVRVSTPGNRDSVTVHVGLGFAFERVQAVKADQRDTHAFTLSVRSRFYPKLSLGRYFAAAHDSGIWGRQRVGVYLKAQWVNAPEGAPPDEAFFGTARIAPTPLGESVLTVGRNEAPGKPQYYQTSYMYPAVVMKSDGRHAYQINAGIALLDAQEAKIDYIEEGMLQEQALVIVARDSPEHWMTSLACSLEATSAEQYLMLETAKNLPVGGTAVGLLTSATGLMCKFGKAEYESLLYDLGTILGGKYLDHLMEPGVFRKLTPRQRTAARVARQSYDRLDDYKKGQERDKWLSNPAASSRSQSGDGAPASKPTQTEGKIREQGLDGDLKELQKSADDLKNLFDNILKK